MGTVKKGSYPSKQIRAGPAPLASFEDLPSDEMDSPENGKLEEDPGDTGSVKLAGEDGYTIGDCETPTPGTLTPNGLDSPQDIDGFIRDTMTPTPSHPMTPVIDVEPSGTSASEIITRDNIEESHQEGSYPEAVHDHGFLEGEGRLLSPSSPLREGHFKGREDSEYLEDEASRKRREKKGFFTSIFKLSGRKSPGKELVSPVKHISHVETLPTVIDGKPSSQISDVPKSQMQTKDLTKKGGAAVERSASKASGLHLPLQEAQSDVSETFIVKDADSQAVYVESLSSVTVKTSQGQFTDLKKPIAFNTKEEIGAEALKREIQDSSESELEFDAKALTDSLKKTESDEDFEAATLLVQDSMEYEDTSITELPPPPPPPPDTTKSLVRTPTRKQRLEVITIPIERPRSTTPINIAPLEAFLQTASPSSDCSGEKIKLSLPGEKFSSRPRSPRKGNPKSWFDFCEEGLQSPRSHRRQSAAKAGFQTLDDATPLSDGGDKTFPSTPETDLFLREADKQQQWTTFGSFKDESELTEKMQAVILKDKISVDQSKNPEEFSGDFFSSDAFSHGGSEIQWHPSDCPCECHTCSCECHNELVTKPRDTFEEEKEQDTKLKKKHINNSDTCPCECHCQFMPSSGSQKGAYLSSSDISLSSRRCSAGSSPSLCSSPDDQDLSSPKNFSN